MMPFGQDVTEAFCTSWGDKGLDDGEENTYTLTLNDRNAPGKLDVWFGVVRPQFMLIDPSGQFVDMSPNPDGGCTGSCGTWNSERYASLLAPHLNGVTATPPPPPPSPTSSTAAPGRDDTSTAADKNVFKALVSGVVFLFVTLALYVQL
mmetsp:Transcript_26401/g.57340  ORF Transcript_26401/g.57340 Transcript_26401/m.57340 type:complete len:149 (-) Transcript_26401:374-820(-)